MVQVHPRIQRVVVAVAVVWASACGNVEIDSTVADADAAGGDAVASGDGTTADTVTADDSATQDDTTVTDTATADTSAEDSTVTDTATADTTTPDTTTPDTTTPDTTTPDTTTSDTATSDTVTSDTVTSDTVTLDAIATDTSPSGCITGESAGCPTGSFCQAPGCGDGLKGVCAPTGGGCTKEYAPVCGCDGTTYGNACMAAAAGRNVASKGECDTAPQQCGGKMGLKCPTGMVCDPKGCGADILGECVTAPKSPCPKTTAAAQQCGCDGTTYGNACLRLLVGVAWKSDGPCPTDTGACKVGDNTGCAADEFCSGSAPGQCGLPGSCVTKPQMCTMIYKPVCGCDGKTYGNSCSAGSAGMAIESDGACP